ncbi:MAG: alpha/beta hydrolase [Proteobacteria bacterium]|nr:alpha/beta hydrolase [Pseudomonadota bacterium]
MEPASRSDSRAATSPKSTPKASRVEAADGLSLHVLEWSDEGVPMLLVHGFGNEAHIWDDFAPHVAPYYRVSAVDLRGHGDSDWDPDFRYDTPDHARDLAALVKRQGFERVVLVAHSLGGRAAMLFAGEHPERLAGLVIVDSAPEIDPRGSLRIRSDVETHREPRFESVAEFERMLAHNYPAARASAIKRMATHGLREDERGGFVLKMDPALRGAGRRTPTPEEMAEHEKESTRALWAALERITCPTLVVRGAASDIVSADVADRMADDVLQNGSLAVVPRAGHSVMTDNPEGFRDAVCSFVLGDG